MKTLVLVSLLSVVLVSAIAADVIDYALSSYYLENPGAIGASVYVIPDGSGVALTNAFSPSGEVVDATIIADLYNGENEPIENYPQDDIWLVTNDGGLVACSFAYPDAASDANGRVTFTLPIAGGGNSPGETVIVLVAATPIAGPGLDLTFNSADINGDLVVNLTDIVEFSQILGGGTGYAGDFNNDGVINLSDIVRFTPAIGTECLTF